MEADGTAGDAWAEGNTSDESVRVSAKAGQSQYEKFYAGAQFVTRGHAFQAFDWERSGQMVDGMLDRTPMPVPPVQIAAE